LKIEVQSPEVEKLHYWIKDNFQNKCEFPWKGHMTLAYVEKDSCDALAGPCAVTGEKYTSAELIFSNKDTQGKDKMPLKGKTEKEVTVSTLSLSGASGDWKKEGVYFEQEVDGNFLTILGKDSKGKTIATLEVAPSQANPSKLFPISVKVEKTFQRKGIASEMYRLAKLHFGKEFVDTANKSPEGKALRKAIGKTKERFDAFLRDSLVSTKGDSSQYQFITAEEIPFLPEGLAPAEGDDLTLSPDRKQMLQTYRQDALRADTFEDFQRLLSKVLLEQKLVEDYRPSVAGILNEIRTEFGYVAL
jgi:hypothetical protein